MVYIRTVSHGGPVDLELPVTVDGITAEWLRRAIEEDVVAMEIDEVISGTATKVLVKATRADASELRLCVKGGFSPQLMAQMGPTYQVEARFYGQLGAGLDAAVPVCRFAGIDDRSGQGIVILDDLRGPGTAFGDSRRPVTADLAAVALEGQASWHATAQSLPDWLPRTPLWRSVLEMVLSEENWNAQVEGGKAAGLPAELRDRDRYLAGLRASWAEDDRAPAGLVHGDANLTNLVITDSLRPWFLDWQLTCAASWAHDVALFVAGSLDVEDRRASERDLIAGYARARRALGDELGDEAAFDAYRRHLLHGLAYAFIPDAMQPPEVCAPFVERFAAAITDHGTLGLLA